jgi:dihydroorotate dehydrogenase
MYGLVRPLLFRLDPERAHHLVLGALRCAGGFGPSRAALRSLYGVSDPRLGTTAFGVGFENPVGLAAGFDKDGVAVRGLDALGLGHIEIGTLTLRPQEGNPKPRIRRFPREQALVNSMGFPNAGLGAFQAASWPPAGSLRTRIGINLGKNKDTPLERAAEESCALLRAVHARADYVALNVSSPNTPGLRELQGRAALEPLLREVARVRDDLATRVPVLVKIAPDLSERELDEILAAVESARIDGIIATNTTLDRTGLPELARGLPGGTSGAPLRARSTAVIRFLAQRTQGRLPIIGVGGIRGAEDALEKIRAGAHLVQVYTGMVYAGPGLVRTILRGLLEVCEREGLRNVAELRGG